MSKLFLESSSPAWKAFNNQQLKSFTFESVVNEFKQMTFFDSKIHDCHASRRKASSLKQLRQEIGSDETASRKCSRFKSEYYSDLLEHVTRPAHL